MVTHAINEIAEVFEKLGFQRMKYPEVEFDYFAFGALNFLKITQQEMIGKLFCQCSRIKSMAQCF